MVDPHTLLRQAKEAELHVKKNPQKYEEKGNNFSLLIKVTVGILVLTVFILSMLPTTLKTKDIFPNTIITFQEATKDLTINSTEELRSVQIKSPPYYRLYLTPNDPYVRTIAGRVIAVACPDYSQLCAAKALYLFVNQNAYYLPDPQNKEYLELPQVFVQTGGGDCESGTLFLANLMESVGIDTELVLVNNHAYLRAWIQDA